MEKKILYQASATASSLEIKEVEYTKKTDNFFYIAENPSRQAMESSLYIYFEVKNDAIMHLHAVLVNDISRAQSKLERDKQKLRTLKEMYEI